MAHVVMTVPCDFSVATPPAVLYLHPAVTCPQVEQLRKQNAELRERVIRACPALDAAALRRAPAGDKPIRRTRTDPT